LYEDDITNVNSALTLSSITFFNSNLTNGGTYGIFAVSGIAVTPAVTSAPEPVSIALIALSGLPVIGAVARRRKV